jgi:RNA polymerase sigma-70 factor (ECF subfamily)
MMIKAPDHDARFATEALPWLPDIARYALSLAGNTNDADDLVQDTFLRAYEKWDQFEPGTECRAWLFTICRRRFFRVMERAERSVATDTPELEALAAAEQFRAARANGLADTFERAEISDAVKAAMNDLPEQFRNVALLVDLYDHSYVSAATVLDVPVGTVRSRLFRARRLLQQALLAHAVDAGFARVASPPAGGTH